MNKPKSTRYPVYINRDPMDLNRLTEHMPVPQPWFHIIAKNLIIFMFLITLLIFLTGA
jgi:hypothetical protein